MLSSVALERALGLAERACAGATVLALDDDPLRLDLPPAPGAAGEIAARTAEAIAALYFAAELEAAGTIVVAEQLAEARLDLETASVAAMELLEAYARQQRSSFPPEQRERLYLRLFGFGTKNPPQNLSSVNRSFEPLVMSLCHAIDTTTTAATDGPVRRARQALTANLAAQPAGPIVTGATTIIAQLRTAVTLLSSAPIRELFAASTMWGVLRQALGSDAPDASGAGERAQSGQQLLRWALAGDAPPDAAVITAARRWLQAADFDADPGSQVAHVAQVDPGAHADPWRHTQQPGTRL